MLSFLRQRRPASRRRRTFTPAGMPVGLTPPGFETLEVRACMDGSYSGTGSGYGDITPELEDLLSLVDADLGRSVGSGDYTMYALGIAEGGNDFAQAIFELEFARADFNVRMDAHLQAFNDYKADLNADMARLRQYCIDVGWGCDANSAWMGSPDMTRAQQAVWNMCGRIVARLDQTNQFIKANTAWQKYANDVVDWIENNLWIETGHAGTDGSGDPIVYSYVHGYSFDQGEAMSGLVYDPNQVV